MNFFDFIKKSSAECFTEYSEEDYSSLTERLRGQRVLCIKKGCGTCGSHEFRRRLNKYTKKEIFKGLRELPYPSSHPRDCNLLMICFEELSLYDPSHEHCGYDLGYLLRNTHVFEVLNEIVIYETGYIDWYVRFDQQELP
jgi:hypothetical protein